MLVEEYLQCAEVGQRLLAPGRGVDERGGGHDVSFRVMS
jgi:hypothetical protein